MDCQEEFQDQNNPPDLARSVGHSTDNSRRWKHPARQLTHSYSSQYADQ